MKFAEGIVYDYLDQNGEVNEAIVTPELVDVSFEELGHRWRIRATKFDEALYRGELSSSNQREYGTAELAVFKAATGAVMLFGKWTVTASGESSQILVQLFPASKHDEPTEETGTTARKSK